MQQIRSDLGFNNKFIDIQVHLEFYLKFQQTSVINPNGTSSSKCRHFICWHTKGHLWIEGFLNTIDGHDMKFIHYPHSLPFLPFYMLIAIRDSFHNNSHTYVTISTAYRVLYTSNVVTTCIQICTRVSLIETRVSYMGCQYQYSHMLSFDD